MLQLAATKGIKPWIEIMPSTFLKLQLRPTVN